MTGRAGADPGALYGLQKLGCCPTAESQHQSSHIVPERLLAVWGQEDRRDVFGNRHVSLQGSRRALVFKLLIFLLAIQYIYFSTPFIDRKTRKGSTVIVQEVLNLTQTSVFLIHFMFTSQAEFICVRLYTHTATLSPSQGRRRGVTHLFLLCGGEGCRLGW